MVEFPWKAIWPWTLVFWQILDYWFDFLTGYGVCSNFPFLPGSVLVVYMFLGICPFIPDCPFYWHIIAHNILLLLFLFLLCWLWSLLFHSWFYLYQSFPFSFWSSWLVAINFVNSFKEKASGFIDLFYCFFSFDSINFCSNLYYFLSYAGLGFICCSFSRSLRCKVRLYIWDLSSFFRKAWIAIYFPLMTAFAAFQRFGLWRYHFHWLPYTF